MRREAYLDAVEEELGRLTRGEREDVRRELAAHMEDHVETLLSIGCTEEEADERAAEAMGDPAETGRAISALYRPFWLWVERIAAVIIVFMVIWLVLGFGMFHSAWSSVYSRFCPPDDREAVYMNEHMAIGDDVVRIYGARNYWTNGSRGVELWLCAYDRVPFGCMDQNIWNKIRFLAGTDRSELYRAWNGDGHSNEGATYFHAFYQLAEAETRVTLRYERFGKVVEHTIDLSEVRG